MFWFVSQVPKVSVHFSAIQVIITLFSTCKLSKRSPFKCLATKAVMLACMLNIQEAIVHIRSCIFAASSVKYFQREKWVSVCLSSMSIFLHFICFLMVREDTNQSGGDFAAKKYYVPKGTLVPDVDRNSLVSESNVPP